MSGYPEGTEVQEKNGRVKKKLGDGHWQGRNRINWSRSHKKELEEGQRVFHIDGDKKNDDPDNLVAITFSGTRYTLSHSRVLWMPKVAHVKALSEAS